MGYDNVSYRGYTISIKKDFGEYGYLIGGFMVKTGYNVCKGVMCNAMPGATWFQTPQDARNAVDDLITAMEITDIKDDQSSIVANKFWEINKARHEFQKTFKFST